MPAITCPQCEGEHDAPFLRCTCGYDAVATARWTIALATHLRNRKLALGSIPAGIMVFVATLGTSMMPFGVVAALLGPAIAYTAHTYVRSARRHLSGAARPTPLPEARLV